MKRVLLRDIVAAVVAIFALTIAGHVACAQDARLREAQVKLRELKYPGVSADGLAGPRTHEALRRYQREHRLPVTGDLDQLTAASLFAKADAQAIPSAPSAKTIEPTKSDGPTIGSPASAATPESIANSATAQQVPPISVVGNEKLAIDSAPTGTIPSSTSGLPFVEQARPPVSLSQPLGLLGIVSAALAATWLRFRNRKRGAARASTSRSSASWQPYPDVTASSPGVVASTTAARQLSSHPVDTRFTVTPIIDNQSVAVARPAAAIAPSSQSIRWVAPGEQIVLGGVEIVGGYFYLSENPRTDASHSERWIIRRSLPIAKGEATFRGPIAPYPSYTELNPNARRAFLEWLASNRSEPATDMGFVWLYFYGLEARMFRERGPDRDIVADEVRRLCTVYAGDHAFIRAAKTLLAAVEAEGATQEPMLIIGADRGYELPLDIRVALGRKIAASKPLTSSDALLWASQAPDFYFRTPALRCQEQFKAIWRKEFENTYPKGLPVVAPKTKLDPSYRAASGGFVAPVNIPGGPLPDVCVLEAAFAKIKDLLGKCSDELDGYSRYVGRNPDKAESASAFNLLPAEQRAIALSTSFGPKFGILLGDAPSASSKVVDICNALQLPLPAQGRIDATTIGLVGQTLDILNIGFEPDARYGGKSPDVLGTIVVFAADRGAPIGPDRYIFAQVRVALEVGALVASIDREFAQARELLNRASVRLESRPDLDALERSRLRASGEAFLYQPLTQAAVFKKFAAFGDDARQNLSRVAVDVVLAGERLSVAEVKFLERLYEALGMDPKALYSVLNQDVSSSAGPSSFVPPRISNIGSEIVLDHEQLARRRADTEVVSRLLSDIFVEDTLPIARADPTSIGNPPFSGLDEPHGQLLERLAADGALDRSKFDADARALRLLPDGAMETINEWALDHFGEVILDDGDSVIFVNSLRPEIDNLRASA